MNHRSLIDAHSGLLTVNVISVVTKIKKKQIKSNIH